MSTQEHLELAAERQEKILHILRDRHIARVEALAEELAVSGSTIRRDLSDLESLGRLRRVHGGAVSIDRLLDEPQFEDKALSAAPEKQAIAEAARRMIDPTESIYLDGGSTVLALARLLTNMHGLTVVTNSLHVAALLATGGPRVILVGGQLRRLSQTFVGSLTQPVIEHLHFDKAFMGTIGISVQAGLTTTDADEAYTKRCVIARAKNVILLADASKIEKISFVKFADPGDIHTLITDTSAPAGAIKEFRKEKIHIVTA